MVKVPYKWNQCSKLINCFLSFFFRMNYSLHFLHYLAFLVNQEVSFAFFLKNLKIVSNTKDIIKPYCPLYYHYVPGPVRNCQRWIVIISKLAANIKMLLPINSFDVLRSFSIFLNFKEYFVNNCFYNYCKTFSFFL